MIKWSFLHNSGILIHEVDDDCCVAITKVGTVIEEPKQLMDIHDALTNFIYDEALGSQKTTKFPSGILQMEFISD